MREDFFKQKEMKKLRRIAGGDTYTIIYLKMQLLSLQRKGVILFESVGENLADELALELDESVDNVQMTLAFLDQHGLIEQLAADEYLLREAVVNMGEESASAERVRKHRDHQRLQDQNTRVLQCNADVTGCNKDVTLEKEKDLDRDLYPPISPHGDGEGVTQSSESLAVDMTAGAGTPADFSMTLIESFEIFWNLYPRKESKGATEKAWKKLNPSSELSASILAAVEIAAKSEQWNRDNGRYIPAPKNWLNDKRWLDKPPQVQKRSTSYDLEMIEANLSIDY